MERSLEDECSDIRAELKAEEARLRALMHNGRYDNEQAYPNQHGEMRAQTMLAIRHVEDARMRVGKILQYADDGVSILDK